MSKIYLSVSDIISIIFSFIFPPISVLLLKGCGKDFCISMMLTIFFFFGGTIHALYLIFTNQEEYTRLDEEGNPTEDNGNRNVINGIPENAIVVILPGATVNTNVPNNLPPPSYAESEKIEKEQKELLYPNLPTYDEASSHNQVNPQEPSGSEKQ
ncbi:UPF0057-domain-containing protein [Anaeromyces robustus]|jgi:uncharacterized membrane protein YqaE (UPF0057 family)|uniref:UPF0057-domain-containing protein n=1 Tax=Anaeromyces robustus TaxID=1754192 RepID=A0A1Y1X0I6_9FUNG|nr:UPF0057-domain-containing protein [Anaeromyces robustus]|eukprot:ORX78936.1 UPF0057-domain-containing protein [Anaeromyces robustus]